MERKLGATIAALRKSKGMTQERLALSLGVSAPAVSKWESDLTCPDITLLCPLARALGTNVDSLLNFEENLSDEQLAQFMQEAVDTARNTDYERTGGLLMQFLHTYPSSLTLKYNTAMTLDLLNMIYPEKKKETDEWKKCLLEEIYQSGPSQYWQYAALGLAFMMIQEDETEKAEALLKELPENTVDETMIWTQLYLRRNETEKALEATQKRLYTLAGQMLSCFAMLMNEKIEPDPKKTLEISKIYHQLEQIFGIGSGYSAGYFTEAYHRLGEREKELESIIQMIDAMTAPLSQPNQLLFSAVVKANGERHPVTKELKEIMLQSLLTDEAYLSFHGIEAFDNAVKKLRESISEG